jgi:hypothetical protein
MRVIISTQGNFSPQSDGEAMLIQNSEPTVVPPVLLDLCTVAIMHRFSSPAWWDHLARHISADVSADAAFDTVVKLQVRRALEQRSSANTVHTSRLARRLFLRHQGLVCSPRMQKFLAQGELKEIPRLS